MKKETIEFLRDLIIAIGDGSVISNNSDWVERIDSQVIDK